MNFCIIVLFFTTTAAAALGKQRRWAYTGNVRKRPDRRQAALLRRLPVTQARNEARMRDQLGLYYHPQAGDATSRVYVRRGPDGEVEFRLWQADHPEVWERHPWLSLAVVRQAARLYQQERQTEADPLRLYDLAVARALLKEAEA